MLKKLDQAFSKVEGFLSVVLFLAMVAIVCWSVICRYALKIPFLQSEELARYLMIYIVYIGTSIGVKSKSHIGVEVFVDMLPEKIYKKVRIFTEILCMLMFVLLFVLSLQMFNHLIMTKQMTTTTQIPTAVVFFCLPMGFFMGIIHYLYSIETMIKDIMKHDYCNAFPGFCRHYDSGYAYRAGAGGRRYGGHRCRGLDAAVHLRAEDVLLRR